MPLVFAHTNDELKAHIASLNDPQGGGFLHFSGRVRSINQHKEVSYLYYEAHCPLAIAMFAELEIEAKKRFGILDCFAVHRLSQVFVGEDAVVIMLLASHRHEALMAMRFLLDELKRILPIWKKEIFVDGSYKWGQEDCCATSLITMIEPVHRALEGRKIEPKNLAQKKVLLIGAGGLGCPLAVNLSSLGIGSITIADGDVVEESNLLRQYIYKMSDQGRKKASLLKQFIEERNRVSSIYVYESNINESQLRMMIDDFHLIIDATDCSATKKMLKRLAYEKSRPLISASVYQQDGEVQVYMPNEQRGCLSCFDGNSLDDMSCARVGVFTHICQLVAAVACDRALAILADQFLGPNELSIIDGISNKRFIMGKDEHCFVCGTPSLNLHKPLKQIVRMR